MTSYPITHTTRLPAVVLPRPRLAVDVLVFFLALTMAASVGAVTYLRALPPPPQTHWVIWSTGGAAPTRLAKFEPAKGCYIGAFIDFDKVLEAPYRDRNKTEHQDPEAFERIVGKSHAMYFFYLGYGKPLPSDWVGFLSRRGKFVHIALEPNGGLRAVKDDAYLRKLADDMRASGACIFLRFASEMNGDWTHYHGDPALYRQKFRLVARVMRQRAPNVAMVWCPYASPTATIPDYYPGDDATDWVGVNMYNVTHHNNDPRAPAYHETPAGLLQFVYDRYAPRKPIMICEYGATHRALTRNEPCPDFARSKILALYRALPTRFPRVKCINYFDGDNMDALPDRGCNDYSVTNDRVVLAAYKAAIRSPHFLTHPIGGSQMMMAAVAPVSAPRPQPAADTTPVTVWLCADSGQLANSYCPEAVPTSLPRNRVPTAHCRLHGP